MEQSRTLVTCATEWVARLRASPPFDESQRMRSGCHHDERGQGLAEYALILALIAIVAVLAVTFLGGSITGLLLDPIGTEIMKVVNGI